MSWKAVGFECQTDLAIKSRIFEEVGKIGIKDTDGEIIIPALYDYIEKCTISNKILFIVAIKNTYGIYDCGGTLIVPVEYTKFYFANTFIIADKRGASDVYNYEGDKILSSLIYKYIKYNDDIIIQGEPNNCWKVYDKTGKEVESGVTYQDIFMNKNFLSVKLNGVWKVIYSS